MRLRRGDSPAPGLPGLLARAVIVSSLIACQPADPDLPFSVYLDVLGRALGTDPPPRAAATAAPLPRRGDLDAHGDDSVTAGNREIDILQLSGCTLQGTLVRTRSALGRHAKPSQRLLLALAYLRHAPPCIVRLRERGLGALAHTLEQGWKSRREHLAERIFDATLGSEEYRLFWRAVASPGSYPRVGHAEALAALDGVNEQVRRWRDHDYRANNLDFELLLGEVAGGGGGALLEALARQAGWLDAADQLLREQLAQDPHCDRSNSKSRGTASRLLDARRYFELEIRPRVTASTLQTREFLAAIAALEALLDHVLPPRYRAWRADRDQRVRSLRQASSRHLERLAQVWRSCVRR